MKIAPAQTESFLKSPNVNFVLCYGPDVGLVSQRAKSVAKTVLDDLSDPFRVVELSYDKIKDDPSALASELSAMSFTGGRRVIRVTMDSSTMNKDVCDVIENAKTDALAVFTAGDLTPASSLRKFFEKFENAAAVACYKDDDAAIIRVVNEKLRAAGFSFDGDVVRYLGGSFGGDRMVIMSEVEKLITYMGSNKNISIEDVRESVFDSSEFSLDDLCNAFASKIPEQIELHTNKALSEEIAPIAVIRSLLRYFMRMQEVKNKIEAGATQQQAVSGLRPPVFFKQVPLFQRHLSMWKNSDISKVISKLIELEIDCKTTGNPAELMCARMLMITPLAVR